MCYSNHGFFFRERNAGRKKNEHFSFAYFSFSAKRKVGVICDEGTPVPIPNTVVKLIYADNTWLETAREDRSMPTQSGLTEVRSLRYSSIAQLVEHAAVNRMVVGSSPT